MEWITTIIEILGALGIGSVISHFATKKVLSNKEKVEVKTDVIGNGAHLIDLYKEMDSIIKKETEPLNEKILELNNKIDTLNEKIGELNNYTCFRECPNRQREKTK